MSTRKLSLDDLLGLDRYEIDEENSHIAVDQSLLPALPVAAVSDRLSGGRLRGRGW